jgi:hypothetical protein
MLSTQEKLAELVRRLKEFDADNLESVILYGSAGRGDPQGAFADLNVLCVVKSTSVAELARIAPVVRWWCKEQKEPAPLVFTQEELRQSADVFSIELLDMQNGHGVLFGPDVIAGITVPMNLHRVQVEHDLRTMLLRLRQHFLHSAGNDAELRALLAKSVSSALVLLRHALIAFGEEVPTTPGGIFSRIAERTGAEAEVFTTVLEMRNSGRHVDEITRLFGRYLSALNTVTSALDKILPKKEWRRVAKANS